MNDRSVTAEELSAPITTFEAAVAQVTAGSSRLAPLEVEISHAAGLVLAADIVADIDLPPFANSAMDGYAVVSDDTAKATEPARVLLTSVAKVMTGWPVPKGFDAVVPWEDVVVDEPGITVGKPVATGTYVRQAGEDLQAGTMLVTAGTVLKPVHLASIAAIGRAVVSVVPRPRVAVLITGDELVQPGRVLPQDTIYDSNGVLLPLLLSRLGAEVVHIGHAGDDRGIISDWLRVVSKDADCIITTGGASVGEHDWMRTILTEDGQLALWRVAVKPGKPFTFGSFADVPVLSLPGNPASVLACTHAFVAPFIKTMMGLLPNADSVEADLSADVHAAGDRLFLCPVTLDGSLAVPAPSASSGTVSNHFDADGFALIPRGGAAKGETVTVELFE